MSNENFNEEITPETVESTTEFSSIPEEPVDAPKKNKKVWAIVIAVVAVLAVVAAILATQFKAVFGSPKSVMKSAVVNLIEDSYDLNEGMYDKRADVSSTDGTVDISFKLEDGLKNIIKEYSYTDLSWLDSANISAQVAADKDGMGMTMVGGLNGTDVASVVYVMDIANEMMYFQIPELSDKFISMDLASLDETGELGNIFELYANYFENPDQVLSNEDLKKLSVKYAELTMDQLGRVTKAKEELTVDGVTGKYYALTTTIDERTANNIVVNVGKALLEDKELEEVVRVFYEAQMISEGSAEGFDNWYGEFKTSLEEAIANAEEELKTLDENGNNGEKFCDLTIYVNARGKFAGIKLGTEEDGEFHLYMPTHGKDFAVEAAFNDGYDSFNFHGAGALSGLKVNGNFNLEASEEEIICLEVKDFDLVSYKKGLVNGELILTAGSSVASDSAIGTVLATLSLDTVFESTKDSSKCDMVVKSGNAEFCSMSMDVELKDVDMPATPDSAISVGDSAAMEEYVYGVSLQTIIDNLKAAGVPDDYVSVLEYYQEYML